MKTVMVDMDDVITNGVFDSFIEEFIGHSIEQEHVNGYFLQDLIVGRENEFRKKYSKKNVYQNAPLLDGCYDVLKRLNEQYDVYIVTSYIWKLDVMNAAYNLKNKFEYLKRELPFIDEHKYIFIDDKSLLNFDIRIDDRVKNLEPATTKLLFSSRGNANISNQELEEKGIIRVNSWREIEKILLD